MQSVLRRWMGKKMNCEYEMIDRLLRKNLDDDTYDEYRAALDSLCHSLTAQEPKGTQIVRTPECFPKSKVFTIEPHGSGYAIYQGRDMSHHGLNLGQLTEISIETVKMLAGRLNIPEPVNQMLLEALIQMVSNFEPRAWGSDDNKADALKDARAAIAAAEAQGIKK